MRHAPALACPVCHAALHALPRALRCTRGHSFDVAREGYVDLLPEGHGRSRLKGDPAEMIRARDRFLGRGHHEPLADAIERTGTTALTGTAGATVLEVGCATGHYVGRFAGTGAGGETDAPPVAAHVLGTDVSKPAVRRAARRYRGALFFVNDVTHRLSVPDASVDLLLDIFAPRNAAEFARVVRPGGSLVVVVPTRHHHRELRDVLPLIGMAADKEERIGAALDDAFLLASRDVLQYRVQLSGTDVADLIAMTPSTWHVDDRTRGAAAAMDRIETTLGFALLHFTRRLDSTRPA